MDLFGHQLEVRKVLRVDRTSINLIVNLIKHNGAVAVEAPIQEGRKGIRQATAQLYADQRTKSTRKGSASRHCSP
jgi:hypothetical protein